MDTNKKINKTPKKKTEENRELLYGVIAIATFIIMAVGATFAYFTATANSGNSAVSTRSTSLKLEYISYESAWQSQKLIPADTRVVEYSVELQNDTTNKDLCYESDGTVAQECNDTNQSTKRVTNELCKDDYGNSICSVYEFQVRNSDNSPQNVSLNIVSEKNGFTNLKAMTYEVSVDPEKEDLYNDTPKTDENRNGINDPIFKNSADDTTSGAIAVVDGSEPPQELYGRTPIYVNRVGVKKEMLTYIEPKTGDQTIKKPSIDLELLPITYENAGDEASKRTTKLADDITINGEETKTFIIVLYIKNLTDKDQTAADAEKEFVGRVVVSTGDGTTGVSGKIGAAGEASLETDKFQ